MMIVRKIFVLSMLVLGSICVYAQTHKSNVQETKDAEIDSLIALQQNLHQQKSDSNTLKTISKNVTTVSLMGYRVQIYTGANRGKAYDEQARFKEIYPDINTYITYKQPNYKVKIGDFLMRSDAEKIIMELRPKFPTLFIFNEMVNLPKEESDVEPKD